MNEEYYTNNSEWCMMRTVAGDPKLMQAGTNEEKAGWQKVPQSTPCCADAG